jgi:hypothetical protein
MRTSIAVALLLVSSVLAFGAASTPVTISSITVASGTATITTSTAHNIPSTNAGVCLQGVSVAVDILCGTALTVPSSTTFTMSATQGNATMLACASSCGTAQPAKNFLILGNPLLGALGLQQVTVCVWNYIQTPLAAPNRTSACASAETNSTLLTSENTALASGTWDEVVITLTLASSDTRAQIEQEFQRIQFARQTAISAGIQPGRDTGTFCDAVGCNQ